MRKLSLFTVAGLFLVTSGLLVYAFGGVFDTDGGFNIYEQGTCIDDFGNHTDVCVPTHFFDESLKEWYPGNGSNGTDVCVFEVVDCADYNATCVNGACV